MFSKDGNRYLTRAAAFLLAAGLSISLLAAQAPIKTSPNADGSCDPGYRLDGNPQICTLYYINRSIDTQGNLIVTDRENHTLRRISPDGMVTTILNNPEGKGPAAPGYSPSGTPALSATTNRPQRPILDQAGNIYYSSQTAEAVQMINMDSKPHFGIPMTAGNVYTLAGRPPEATTAIGYTGDGGPATAALVYNPSGLDVDIAGNVYFADIDNHAIRMINADGLPHFGQNMKVGYIYTIAGGLRTPSGSPDCGFKGDGGLATNAWLNFPQGVAADSHGNVYFGDWANNAIRRIDAKTGILTHVAGAIADDDGNPFEGWHFCLSGLPIQQPTRSDGFSGDGGLAIHAKISAPTNLTFDRFDNLYFTDSVNNVVRKIEAQTGIITTVIGQGGQFITNGTGKITAKPIATLKVPTANGWTEDWTTFELFDGETFLKALPVNPGAKCLVNSAQAVGAIADIPNGWPQTHMWRDLQFLMITDDVKKTGGFGTWATSSFCMVNNGGVMIDAAMTNGTTVSPTAVIPDGYSMPWHYRILPDGTRTSVSFSGDGGIATEALLHRPAYISVDMDFNLYVYDQGAHRYRMVPTSDGVYFGIPMLAGHIYTIAGDGHLGLWTGDGKATAVSF